jgi:hypothetical protein
MFALTADQVDSRHSSDLADDALARLAASAGSGLVLPPDRTAGDEIQFLSDRAATALHLVLDLARTRQWSIGLGIGEVREPLPAATRIATGPAFELARDAVESAKKRQSHFALRIAPNGRVHENTLQPLIELLLQLRSRRTPEGWELLELLESGMTQVQAAAALKITPQAVSLRSSAGQLRLDIAARPALVTLLADADGSIGT